MSTVPNAPAPPPPALVGPPFEVEPGCEPKYEHLITEDHQPVDRILVEKLYVLLKEPLYASWPGPGPGRPFLVLTNVGYFYRDKNPALVPDCLLSLDVTCPEDLHVKEGHSYYQWDRGKPPEVIIEVVSDRKGGEDGLKMSQYAQQGIAYYAIFDPDHYLSPETLRCFALVARTYQPTDPGPWPNIGLGLRLWEGSFEGAHDTWLRWCDANGVIIPTGEERAAVLAERNRELEAELRRLKGKKPPGRGDRGGSRKRG